MAIALYNLHPKDTLPKKEITTKAIAEAFFRR
jgi:hypothetical protein